MNTRRNAPRVARSLLAAAAVWLLPSIAGAHQVWIEEKGGNTNFYFGEYGDNQREESPGYLDKLSKPMATLITAQGEKVLEGTKTRDAISFKGKAGKGESVIVIDAAYPVSERSEGDKPQRSLWTPAARYVTDLKAQTPKLPLDIVPTGRSCRSTSCPRAMRASFRCCTAARRCQRRKRRWSPCRAGRSSRARTIRVR
jgi:hypothetical protein